VIVLAQFNKFLISSSDGTLVKCTKNSSKFTFSIATFTRISKGPELVQNAR